VSADSPRGSCSSGVLRVLARLSFQSVMALSFRWEKVSDSPQQRADGPRVPGGQSACSPRTVRYSWSSLEVLCVLSDGPRRRAVQSAVLVRTVCGSRPDGPCGQCGRSAPLAEWSARACVLCFLVRFLSSFLVLPRMLQGIVPRTRG
jgi:hypothetical protein